MKKIALALSSWQKKEGRNNLPWQGSSVYKTWISEVMLQQTQVSTVQLYFSKFIQRFPNLHALSNASLEEVLSFWRGLGYYRRAMNLHQAAQYLVSQQQGKFPVSCETWMKLSGVGRSTAGAIMALALGEKGVILEGNTKRILARLFGFKDATEKELWFHAEALVKLLPKNEIRSYTQGLMDLGNMLCKPRSLECLKCPWGSFCQAKLSLTPLEFYPKTQRTKLVSQEVFWVLWKTEEGFLFQKNQSGSIWPNLLIPLSFENQKDVSSHIQSFAGRVSEHYQINHRLTHRKLLIHLWVVLSSLKGTVSSQGDFYSLKELETLPIPKPLITLVSKWNHLSSAKKI